MSSARPLFLALALVAGAVPGGAHAAEPAATTLLYHAQVFTADPAHPYAEAVAIRDDRILAVGALAEVERAAGNGARRVDLKGRFLMPGMLDAHAHPIAGGLSLILANFPDASDSISALAAFVKAQAGTGTSRLGDVLVVNGLDTGYWVHAAEIDQALSGGAFARQPLVLYGSDGHTLWANRALRERAGVTAAYLRGLPPDQRRYYGFGAGYEPNGFAVDFGATKISAAIPAASPALLLQAGEAAVHYMNGLGITGWLDAAASGEVGGTLPASADRPGYLPAYRALAQRGELTAHVAAYPVVQPDLGSQQIDVVEALRARYRDVPHLSIPGLKVFADGVVEIPSQTAAMIAPYTNTGHRVGTLFTPEKMNRLVSEAYRRGLTVHIHAIGDLAVRQSLDAFEAARAANPGTQLPFVMTHVQFADPADIPRFGRLGVIAALQLDWAIADPSTNEQIRPYVDPAIYRWMYPARSILDSGGTIAGASDWPVSTANPFEAIFQAETRAGPQGVLEASERMPREAMLYAYTRNSAEAMGELGEIGTITPGKYADLALLDRDVLTVPAAQMKEAVVLFTMFGGRIVYGREP
jgi:predicted amidohydrolase YtcJ